MVKEKFSAAPPHSPKFLAPPPIKIPGGATGGVLEARLQGGKQLKWRPTLRDLKKVSFSPPWKTWLISDTHVNRLVMNHFKNRLNIWQKFMTINKQIVNKNSFDKQNIFWRPSNIIRRGYLPLASPRSARHCLLVRLKLLWYSNIFRANKD